MTPVDAARARRVAARAAAVAAGLVWGFFVAFNVVFSDVFGASAMAGAVGFVLVAYGVLGALFGLVEPSYGWRWVLWLAPPGVLAVVSQIADAPERWPYHVAVALAVILGSAVAAAAAGRLRRAR